MADENEYCDGGCVDNGMVVFIVGVTLILAALAGYFIGLHAQTEARCVPSNEATVAQAAATKAQLDANAAMQKRLFEVQDKVLKACADRGGVPIITNGNVSCEKY